MTGRNHLRIRPATIDDAETIYAAIVRLGHFLGTPEKVLSTVDDLRKYGFGSKPAFSTLIAEMDKDFAGMCLHFPIFSTWLGRPGVYVQDLYVDDRFRGRKIGELLLRHVAALGAEDGAIYLRLAVDVDNVTAQAFYEKLGISWVSEDKSHAIFGDAFLAFARTSGDL